MASGSSFAKLSGSDAPGDGSLADKSGDPVILIGGVILGWFVFRPDGESERGSNVKISLNKSAPVDSESDDVIGDIEVRAPFARALNMSGCAVKGDENELELGESADVGDVHSVDCIDGRDACVAAPAVAGYRLLPDCDRSTYVYWSCGFWPTLLGPASRRSAVYTVLERLEVVDCRLVCDGYDSDRSNPGRSGGC